MQGGARGLNGAESVERDTASFEVADMPPVGAPLRGSDLRRGERVVFAEVSERFDRAPLPRFRLDARLGPTN
jgi:hypothetical protein